VAYCSGAGPYPSVTLRLDFRDPGIVGTFVYHCHILGHEDNGMMAALQLLPAGIATATKLTASAASLNVNTPLTLTAQVIAAVDGQPVNGTVQFALDGVPIGAPVPVSNGQATYTTRFPASGSTRSATFRGLDRNESPRARAVGGGFQPERRSHQHCRPGPARRPGGAPPMASVRPSAACAAGGLQRRDLRGEPGHAQGAGRTELTVMTRGTAANAGST
jgi:hypothetical protein